MIPRGFEGALVMATPPGAAPGLERAGVVIGGVAVISPLSKPRGLNRLHLLAWPAERLVKKGIFFIPVFVVFYRQEITVYISINQRIKQVRETLHLTQVQFSKVISLSSGYLAGVEVEKRKANDRIVKLICAAFSVNEHWLRDGEGEMFSQNPDEEFTKLVSLFKELTPQFQNYILKQIDLLLDIQDSQAKSMKTHES
jgi:DNA-binding XRE family transcriptional regulator